MYLNKSAKGIGWFTSVTRNQNGEKMEHPAYIIFTFKKGTEPTDPTIEGDLYFIDRYGRKRKVFPYYNDYGQGRVEFKILEEEGSPKMAGKVSDSAKSVDISPEELPFY